MPFTMVGFAQSQDTANALTAVNALADQHVRVSGADIIVPSLNQLLGAYAGGVTITRAQLRSPSLRRVVNVEIAPVNIGTLAPNNPPALWMRPQAPIALTVNEALNMFVAENVVGAEQEDGVVWLADAPVAPVGGEMFVVRVTGATTLTANAWTNGSLTFDQTLPAGSYNIVGARMESTNIIAFRFVPVGGTWRPGGLGTTTAARLEPPGQRSGGWGVWATFAHLTPPTVDYLASAADAAESGELDLVKVA